MMLKWIAVAAFTVAAVAAVAVVAAAVARRQSFDAKSALAVIAKPIRSGSLCVGSADTADLLQPH